MEKKSYLGILGSLLVIGGALSPMLRIPVIGNWNYWDIEPVLAAIVLVLAGLGLIGAVFSKPALLRFCGWAALAVVLFTLCAVYFKVNSYFSFIPLKKLAAAAAGIVRYRWMGWLALIMGSALMILAGNRRKPAGHA
ncbi:MAG TPA: hypothetical protein VGE15_02725 [Sphingobacteriaceae bacterium]